MAHDEHLAEPVPRTPPPAHGGFPLPQSHPSPLASPHRRPLAASPISATPPSNGHAAGLVEGSSRRPMSPLTSRSLSVDSTTPPSSPNCLSYSSLVSPAPAYVAPAGAAQVVNEDEHVLARGQWSEEDSDLVSGEPSDNIFAARRSRLDVRFAPPALGLVNSFLDYLLYAVLATTRSTSLHALRPAVTEVLKSRLAREAIASADEELAGLLAGADEDEDDDDGADERSTASEHDWEVELVWRRTRLRVMVYMRLGEVEDEDEERYVREDDFFRRRVRRFSQTAGLVPWAAAIFLTSVLEHVAEQTLLAAAQTALAKAKRVERGHRLQMGQSYVEDAGVVSVEDSDVEKVALNSTLGRLWRTWRKVHRKTGPVSPQTTSNRFNTFFGATRDVPSSATTAEVQSPDRGAISPDLHVPEHVMAANVPLPRVDGKRDVDGIDIPGLARNPDDHEAGDASTAQPAWRNTLDGLPAGAPAEHLGIRNGTPDVEDRPRPQRQRSSSLPTPPRGLFSSSEQNGHRTDIVHAASDEVPEPKSSLEDMAQYKARPGATPPVCEAADEAGKGDQRTIAEDSDNGNGIIAGGLGMMAASIAAVGAGAAALVNGTKSERIGETSISGADQPNSAREEETSRLAAPTVGDNTVAGVNGSRDDRALDVEERQSNATVVAPPQYAGAPHTAGAPAAFGAAGTSDLAALTKEPHDDDEASATTIPQQPLRPTLIIEAANDSSARQEAVAPPQAVTGLAGVYNVTQPSPIDKTRPFPGRSISPHVVSPISRHSESPDAARRRVSQVSAFAPSPQETTMQQNLGKPGPSLQDSPTKQRAIHLKKDRLSPSQSPEPPIASLTSASIRGPEDFDVFLQAPETVKYTLTPQGVRDGTSSPSPGHLPGIGQTKSETSDPRASRKTTPKPATAAVVPTSATSTPSRSRSIAEIRRSASKPNTVITDSPKPNGLVTRPPRAITESTRDFADFIRSTGPEEDSPVLPVMSKASASSFHSTRAPHLNMGSGVTSTAVSRPGSSGSHADGPRNAPARSATVGASPPPVPSLPRTMQPRSATATSHGNADLIDFIRAGPDERGKHRIPRTVAPFRTTMDSDQFRELGDPLNGEPPLPVGVYDDASRRPSVQSTSSALEGSARTSVNSRSALLVHPVNTSVAPAVQPLRSVPAPSQADGRRRFRDKDPYSTAFVDEDGHEDDDHLTALPSQQRHEESLMEFLRNSDPPSTHPVRPIAASSTPSTARVSRQSNFGTSRAAPAPSPSGATAYKSVLDPMAARSHSAIGSPPVHSPSSSLSPAPYRPRMEARGATGSSSRSATADLADFLKSSGPPLAPGDRGANHDDNGPDDGAPAPVVAKGARLSTREAEKRRRREGRTREKELRRATSAGAPAAPPSSGGGGGAGGFLSGFGMRKKTSVDVS